MGIVVLNPHDFGVLGAPVGLCSRAITYLSRGSDCGFSSSPGL